jgi:hypothetical protein
MPPINPADYVTEYRFFAEEEFYEQNDERLRRQFKDTPLWGKG